MLSAILIDIENEPIRLEYMGDGMFFASQLENGREHQITVSEDQLRVWVKLALLHGLDIIH